MFAALQRAPQLRLCRGLFGSEPCTANRIISLPVLQSKPLGLFAERCDVRYNFACASSACGRVADAAAALRRLLALGHVTAEQIAADDDFADVRSAPEFQQLLLGYDG